MVYSTFRWVPVWRLGTWSCWQHITFDQAKKECNNDIEKYLQDVNKHINEITLESRNRKKANLVMLADIASLPQECIKYGEKRWMEIVINISYRKPSRLQI